MSEREFNEIFSKRLRHYLDLHEMTQVQLAKRLGVGTTSVYNWLNGIKTPRMDKVDAMCQIFNCKRADLMEDRDQEQSSGYYTNPETAKIAQEIFENSDMRALFDAARDATPEELRKAAKLIKVIRGGDEF